jgi:polyhydroxyalkanoate synthesis regulator phasin
MATQLATVELRLVPTEQTQKEIENTIDAPRRLAEAIEEFKRKRANAEAELAQSLAKDLAAGPLNVESAIEKHKAFKARDDLLASKINTAEELRPIIEELIEELKRSQPDALKAVLRRKLEQLEKEAAAEQDKAELLKEQIDSLKALLEEIDKPAAAAKRRKE